MPGSRQLPANNDSIITIAAALAVAFESSREVHGERARIVHWIALCTLENICLSDGEPLHYKSCACRFKQPTCDALPPVLFRNDESHDRTNDCGIRFFVVGGSSHSHPWIGVAPSYRFVSQICQVPAQCTIPDQTNNVRMVLFGCCIAPVPLLMREMVQPALTESPIRIVSECIMVTECKIVIQQLGFELSNGVVL